MKRNSKIFRFVSGIFLFAILLSTTSCEKNETVIDSSTALKGKSMAKKGSSSIGEIALANEDFEELVMALLYVDRELDAGLVDLFVNGTDQYTVFAPTDMAFEALYAATGAASIKDLPASLVLDVLLYHVTEGRRGSNSVVPKNNPRKIETLLGAPFYVNADGSIDAVGNMAGIVAADISASNGIIHVINTVILPIEL